MVSEIKIPGIIIKYEGKLPKTQLLLVGGGRQPSKAWLQEAATGRTLWCIDHGVDICHQLGLVPERLLGDFDSCNNTSLQWAKGHGTIIEEFDTHKDFTDTQAALKLAREKDAFCILTGALGKRFDHTYSTIFSFGNSATRGCIADEQEAICFLHDNETITISADTLPKAISLLPISEKVTGVTTKGLYWELNEEELSQIKPYAVSNVLAENRVTNSFSIGIAEGTLAVYICRQENQM